MTFSKTFSIEATAPFDFDLTARIFRNGDKQIRAYTNGQFSQLLRINGRLVLAKLRSKGTIEQPKIEISLSSNDRLTAKDKKQAEEIVRFIFNLDFTLTTFYHEIEKDQIMHRITQQLYGLKSPTTMMVFEALVDSIVEQQISIKVAHTLEERLVKNFGESLIIEGETYYTYPTPKNFMQVGVGKIQGCGLTQRKAQYISEAARLIEDGKIDLENLKDLTNIEEIISKLDNIKGIGIWTAELTMLRGMQKLNALPADDLGIRRVVSSYYCAGKSINSEEARKIAESWGRWKGLAAFYLVVAEINGISV